MGLFFQEENNKRFSKSSKRKHIPIETLRAQSCNVCTLNNADIQSPKMDASGTKDPDVYVLGAAPTYADDVAGFHLVGDFKRTLKRYVKGVRWRFNNVIQCHPDERAPKISEIECCRNRIADDIAKTKPTYLITLGTIATTWALGENANVNLWRGRYTTTMINGHVCWVFPILDPTTIALSKRRYGISDEESASIRDIRHISKLIERLPEPQIISYAETDVTSIDGSQDFDYRKLRKILRRMYAHGEPVGIDVETHPMRPYAVKSMLVSIAIADGNECVSIPVERPDGWPVVERKKVLKLLKWFLFGKNLKICHSQDMEMSWLASRFGTDVFSKVNWADSLALAYVLDNRRGSLSLDFQCRQWLGERIKNKHSVNLERMDVEPLRNVLPYNGIDAIACRDVFLRLRKEVRKVRGLWSVYESQVARARVYSHSVANGVPVDKSVLIEYEERLQKQIDRAYVGIQNTVDAKLFKRKYGRTYTPNNERDDTDLFVHMLKRDEVNVERKNKNGKLEAKVSFDKAVLAQINRKITRRIVDYRESVKLMSTYITPIHAMIEFDGNIHANVNDKFTNTSRTSYTNPNLQNYPRRKNNWVRGYVVMPDDFWLLGFDYGQIEARVIAMLSHDQKFIHALWNDLDIHMEWTEIFLDRLPYMWDRWAEKADSDDEVKIKKLFRDHMKNRWVFPRFFGASDKACATYMEISERESENLGADFWDDFEGVKTWQDSQKETYKKKGYLQLPTGRRVHAPLSFNKICNYPIQGTASEIQKDAMVRIYNKYGMAQIFEIHDDLSYGVLKTDVDRLRSEIAEEMCMCEFDFINVPLTVECKEGQTWATMEETVTYRSTDFGHQNLNG